MLASSPIHVLFVDDEASIRILAEKVLNGERLRVRTAQTARQGLDLARQQSYDVVVLDVRLPDGDGTEYVERFRETMPDVEVILITGHGDIDSAVQAVKTGAYDYVSKPFDLHRLEMIIERAYQRVCLKRENRLLRQAQTYKAPPQFVGRTPAVLHIHYLIAKVAPTDVPVLITGETGAGKDVVARTIHLQSRRAEKPLFIKNCGSLQKELMRSELFGYVKGAFTGANESRDGLLTLSNEATLFMDEVGELPLEVQVMLLRVIESQVYRKVGDKLERKADVRFLFATNRNLAEESRAGRFHDALYHRLNVFQIDLPPLRERREDIPLLVEYYLGRLSPGGQLCQVSKNVMDSLMAYDWPGNIRELRNVIERGIILAENGLITSRALPREVVEQSQGHAPQPREAGFPPITEVEKRHILRALEAADGNRSQAAYLLGIGRKTLYRKLKEYGLE